MSILVAKAFMATKKELLRNLLAKHEEKIATLKREFDPRLFEIHTGDELLQYKEEALRLVQVSVPFFAKNSQFVYKKLQIKNTVSRWGSCSSKGTLSFHYKILFLPKELQRYLIVHELCHLKEMNHSKRFWDAVKHEYPEYEGPKRRLKSLPMYARLSS
jgi:hypothetical protein